MLRRQRGQAMVELALLLPLLIILLLAVGYFGHTVISHQSLNVAARFAARKMAIASTAEGAHRTLGTYTGSAESFLRFGRVGLEGVLNGNQLGTKDTQLNHFPYSQYLDAGGQFTRISDQMFLYQKTDTINAANYLSPPPADKDGNTPANLTQLKVGLGALFYGGTLTYQLNELEPIALYLGLRNGLTIQATSLMPAELPLRSQGGGNYGLLDLNPWISDIVTEDINNLPNLID